VWKIPPETLPNVIEVKPYTFRLIPSSCLTLIQFFYITEIFYAPPLAFAKISVLLLYLRIFMAPWFRFIAWTTIVCVAASAATTTFVAIFQCIPIQSIWNPSLPKRCIDVNTFTVTTATINTALDVVIIVIPLPELRTLKLHWKRKVGVFVVFLTGSL
jgi:hypothetical protein